MKFLTFWAINAPLDTRELCRQLDAMRAEGFDGAVWHPRFYPNTPPYLSDEYLAILSQVILHAKSVGMEFWIYDENGWPSGTVGGELLRRHPECRQQWRDSAGQVHYGEGVDYLNPNLARHFLEMTYERYRQGLSPKAWEHVTTFFSDEPEFGLGHAYDKLPPTGAIPWTSAMKESWFDTADRVRFWESLTDRFCEAFIIPINDWCRQHGKRFTAHMKGEEHPLFQVPMVGSCHQVFQHLALPGIDALERFPSGHFFPRQVASAAQQFGTGECMVECFGGAGWGASPEDLERYLIWLAEHGLTHFVTHLYQYRLTTDAIQDWPPSHPAHVNWREVYPVLLERVKRHAVSRSQGATTLVVAPCREIMASFEPWELKQMNVHNAATYADTTAGRLNRQFLDVVERVHQSGETYHVSDERSVEQHGKWDDDQLQLGKCRYARVISLNEPDPTIENGSRGRSPSNDARGGRASPRAATATITASVGGTTSVLPIVWELTLPARNDLVLESEPLGDGWFQARFEAAAPMEVELCFADDVQELAVNGSPVVTRQCRVAGRNEIRYRAAAPSFLAVRGRFLVKSRSPWQPGRDGTITTAGPFRIEPVNAATVADYPFCRGPLTIRGQFDGSGDRLRLVGVAADAARVFVDGADCGWSWGPDWEVTLSSELSAGQHRLEVQLIPSTYNFFGPHRHIDGDRHIVSSAQFAGQKNFADRPDAPEQTRGPLWHFKPLRLPTGIVLQDGRR